MLETNVNEIENEICAEINPKTELKKLVKEQREQLAVLQTKVTEAKLPVLVMVEGFSASGKGSQIGRMIQQIDPRFYRVASLEKIREEDKRKPFLWRYFTEIPENGRFVFMDSGWMSEAVGEYVRENITKEEYMSRVESIRSFERQLYDNGYLVVKMFLHISKKEQKKRMKKLKESVDTKWRITEEDKFEHKHYALFDVAYTSFMAETNQRYAPWHIIEAKDRTVTEHQMLNVLIEEINKGLKKKTPTPLQKDAFPKVPVPKLSAITFDDKVLDDASYKKELKKLQKELRELHNVLYHKRIPVVIAYEGWDAAGKGGNIKRLAAALDARGCVVHPIASPTPPEKNRHYLWRFYNRLPRTGHVAIFDRTWYGRVMVERLEGFCSEHDWKRAYREMNEFEKDLTDWGAIVIKFWVHIDKDTQLERFTERQNTPEKQWKITDEDWRNREKWDAYEVAVNEMLKKTSTEHAPWYILESKDKKYARIKALRVVIDEIKKKLD